MTAWQLLRWLRRGADDDRLPSEYRHASMLDEIRGPAPGYQPDAVRSERITQVASYVSRLPGGTCPTPASSAATSDSCWFCEDGLAQAAIAHVDIFPPPDFPVLPTRPPACALCLTSLANLTRLYVHIAQTKKEAAPSS